MYTVKIEDVVTQFRNCNNDIVERYRNELEYPNHLINLAKFWHQDYNCVIEKDIRAGTFNRLFFDSKEDFVVWYIRWS